MNSFVLKSPDEAEREIAKVFKHGLSAHGGTLGFFCRDEGAFLDNAWLPLGRITLAAKAQLKRTDGSVDELVISKLLKLGAYDWSTPNTDEARAGLSTVLGVKAGDPTLELDFVLADVASIAVRVGFSRPTFDPSALEDMPYRRPTTIVADTSGVLQGGLDFVATFLHPAARVKVPAIVNMELTGAAEAFFALRRARKRDKPSQRRRQLVDHLKSQGGQRALLRLELQADTEVERTFLLGDPLREAFATDNDGDVAGLNISRSIGAYADRLILEAARHHQAQTGPTHEVRLLTGDQGLARMALAEGMAPLYFKATKTDQLFGSFLTGRTLHPFTGRAQSISLATMLWEFATAFGAAKVQDEESGSSFTVCALGKDMTWSPYHSLEDLLWCSTLAPEEGQIAPRQNGENAGSGIPEEGEPRETAERTKRVDQESVGSAETDKIEGRRSTTKQPEKDSKVAFLRFDVSRLFRLICALDDLQELSADDVIKILGVKSEKGGDEYRRFLSSAGLVHIENKLWKTAPGISRLSGALRNERSEEVHECLLAAPSYQAFVQRVGELEVGEVLDRDYFGRGVNAYRILGEIGRICAEVRGEGIYTTSNDPQASLFAPLARQRFEELEGGDGLVAAGAWLEALIRKDGIHPVVARRRLDQASEFGLIHRSTEGSTTQIRNDEHVLYVLRVSSGMPRAEKAHLYRGDFLIPGKASVSLRIREAKS